MMDVITYPRLDSSEFKLIKGALCIHSLACMKKKIQIKFRDREVLSLPLFCKV